MSLIDELNASASRIVDCVRFAAVWVGHIDHEFSEEERAAILMRLPDRARGMRLDQIVDYVRVGMIHTRATDLAKVFGYIRQSLSPESREPLMRLVCEVVAADGRVSIGERHAIAFLADLISKTRELPAIFEEETGLPWTAPPDLSDADYWDRLDAGHRERAEARGESASGPRSRNSSHRDSAGGSSKNSGVDAARAEALATLGLVGTPSAEELKAAYRRLARVHHPDRFQNLDEEAVGNATRTFQRINAAYGLLTR